MSMTVSGQVVKRAGKLFGAGQVVKTRQIVRAMKRAKTRTSWAYALTETGRAVLAESQVTESTENEQDWPFMSEAARQAVANLDALVNRRADALASEKSFEAAVAELNAIIGLPGDGVAEILLDVRRSYTMVLYGNLLTMTGCVYDDYVLIEVDGPRCFERGRRAKYPALVYEMVARVWLSEQNGGEA